MALRKDITGKIKGNLTIMKLGLLMGYFWTIYIITAFWHQYV